MPCAPALLMSERKRSRAHAGRWRAVTYLGTRCRGTPEVEDEAQRADEAEQQGFWLWLRVKDDCLWSQLKDGW